VDRRALRDLFQQDNPAMPVIPANELQQKIVNVWREVLQQPVAGLDCNFFDVGGDSIRIASVHVHLQRLMNRQFPITDLFVHTTIRSLVAYFSHRDKLSDALDTSRSRAQRQRQAFSAQNAMRRVKTNCHGS
jgi:Phosphopantetheine attachment site